MARLQFGNEAQNKAFAGEVSDINAAKVAFTDMGGFVVATDPTHIVRLLTTGAGPCAIIVVHGTNRKGALGHYSATGDHTQLADAVTQMVEKLGLGPAEVDTILFSAGHSESTGTLQKHHENQVCLLCKSKYPVAAVVWAVQPRDIPPDYENNTFGACSYLPSQDRAALFYSGPVCGSPSDELAGCGARMYSYVSKPIFAQFLKKP